MPLLFCFRVSTLRKPWLLDSSDFLSSAVSLLIIRDSYKLQIHGKFALYLISYHFLSHSGESSINSNQVDFNVVLKFIFKVLFIHVALSIVML